MSGSGSEENPTEEAKSAGTNNELLRMALVNYSVLTGARMPLLNSLSTYPRATQAVAQHRGFSHLGAETQSHVSSFLGGLARGTTTVMPSTAPVQPTTSALLAAVQQHRLANLQGFPLGFSQGNVAQATSQHHAQVHHHQAFVDALPQAQAQNLQRSPQPTLSSQSVAASLPSLPNLTLTESLRQARQQATSLIEHFIQTQLPATDTIAYFTALRVAPHLVRKESDPIKFLQCSEFNTRLAAEHLVLYWQQRQTIFGERAFLPITLTGDGALSAQDVDCWKNGRFVFLPNDQEGCTVTCFDTSRYLDLDHTLETRLRAAFYCGQVMSESKKTQTVGWVSLCVLSDSKFDAPTMRCLNMLLTTFPNKIKAWHVFNCMPPSPGDGSYLLGLRNFQGLLQRLRTYVHETTNKQEIVMTMEAHGISQEGLPELLGGSWSNERFMLWLNERTRTERGRFSLSYAFASDEKDTKLPGAKLHEATDGNSGDDSTIVSPDIKRLMDKALTQLPPTDKEIYSEVLLSTSDELRKNEANPDCFLRVEELNCWLAAKRLIEYWKLRSDTFKEKKYSALNQTGEGAMERKELATLGTGFVSLLPNDDTGCPVVWIDSWRIRQSTSKDCVDRCLFYMFNLLAENTRSQKHGASLLYMLADSPFDGHNFKFLERLAKSLPIRFKAVHLLSLRMVPADLASQIEFGDEVRVHVAATKAELGSTLEACGFDLHNLPKRVNGDWGYEKFVQWQELRTRFEWNIPVGLSGRSESAGAFNFPAIRPYSALSEEEKTERKRRMNVIHSRRKRDRERIEIDVLQEHCTELREVQVKLRQENAALEGLFQSAALASVQGVQQRSGNKKAPGVRDF